jgi:RNA polymerase sigma factor (sigma-70 family)
MSKDLSIVKDNFEQLLTWLDPDRDIAGQKYEVIRTRLIRVFELRGCFKAEELTDETINRVTAKIHRIVSTYEGDPVSYFLGVARNVSHEFYRQPQQIELSKAIAETEPAKSNKEDGYYRCLQQCLKKLTTEQRDFILAYYAFHDTEKVETRRAIAEKMNISVSAMHLKAFRIREKLENCCNKCVKKGEIF